MATEDDRIAVACPCGKSYRVPAAKAGKRFACKACGETLRVVSPASGAPGPKSRTKRPGRREPRARGRNDRAAARKASPLALAAVAAAGLLAGACAGLVAVAVWGEPVPAAER